jgi:hypothetical protein
MVRSTEEHRLGRSAKQADLRQARLKRLAERIEQLADKDASTLRRVAEVRALRQSAMREIYDICSHFVDAVNELMVCAALALDPPDSTNLREDGSNLLQINVRGRILQVEFEATDELVSTEDFRIPYTLHGTVRTFNQELLDKDLIEEQLLYYTLEKDKTMWRFFDARTYRSGAFDQEYLVSLMEHLL